MNQVQIMSLKMAIVDLLKKDNMFDAYKLCVKIGKEDLELGNLVVDLHCPEQTYCLDEDRLYKLAATILAMPRILTAGSLVKLEKMTDKLITLLKEQQMEEELKHFDWNRQFFKN